MSFSYLGMNEVYLINDIDNVLIAKYVSMEPNDQQPSVWTYLYTHGTAQYLQEDSPVTKNALKEDVATLIHYCHIKQW